MNDLILVSVDDHVVEPPTMFDAHVPMRWRDRAPRVARTATGADMWVWEGRTFHQIGLNAVAGRLEGESGMDPTSFEEMRPGCWDIHERVRDMNANGILGSLCFPSWVRFCGQVFAEEPDREVALVMLRAYNDWHVDEWAGTYPGRFIPCGVLPLWDPALMADEVRRLSAKGCHAVTFSENPYHLGFPSFHTRHWDPFWAACADEGTVVCLHFGSSSTFPTTTPDAPVDVSISLSPIQLFHCAADLVWSHVLREFDGLKVALSEGGIGWIPYALERMDHAYDQHAHWTNQDFRGGSPSDVFREHIISCFIEDPHGLRSRDRIGVQSICWESDFPHSDSTWPRSPETVLAELEGIPDDEIALMTHENAIREFRFDPFVHRSRERATVGALRADATDVDVTPRSYGQEAHKPTRDGIVRLDDFAASS